MEQRAPSGEPDLSVITATELATLARTVAEVSDSLLIADTDTGFGGPLNIARTIAMYEAAGLTGCHIESPRLLSLSWSLL